MVQDKESLLAEEQNTGKINGLLDEFGRLASLSRRRLWVQVPSTPPFFSSRASVGSTIVLVEALFMPA